MIPQLPETNSNEWLHAQLLDKFAPVALALIQDAPILKGTNWEKLGLKPSVYSDHDSEMVRVCILKLELTKNLCCNELMEIARQLDYFCEWEDDGAVEIAGEEWCIGDGDDSGAVMFHHNAFHVWLRHFKYDTGSELEPAV